MSEDVDLSLQQASGGMKVWLLADRADLVEAVTDLRWREWGHAPQPTDRNWWREATIREAGNEVLPVTWVALDGSVVLGVVGLGQFDIEERRDRSPWVLGMVVRADRRGHGVGRLLLESLVEWASQHEHGDVWVATGGPAVDFYERCGWAVHEVIAGGARAGVSILRRRLTGLER